MSGYARAALSAIVLVAALALEPGFSSAQEQPSQPALSPESVIEAARAALAAGKPEDAAFLLEGVAPGEGDIDDVDFLWGSVAMARGEWQAAIARFRAMLSRDPTLLRVRLDLALAYFRAGEDGSAAYHFRQALAADDLPLRCRPMPWASWTGSGGASRGR